MNNVDEVLKILNKTKKGGRGKKQCPNCHDYVGIRTCKCVCGHTFNKKKKNKQEEDVATEEERLYAMCIGAPGGRLVYAASGSPSARLTDFTYEAVSDYCNLVVHEGIQKGGIYTIHAIKNYLQHQFGYNSEEYRQVSELVDKWYNEKICDDTFVCTQEI